MGKRRNDLPHKQRYDESDDDDDVVEEEELEKEPLKPEQIANIQSRKKLIAKRRVVEGVSSTSSTTSPFTAFSSAIKTGVPANTEESGSAPSVFAGFKGFSAFKQSNPSSITLSTSTLTEKPQSNGSTTQTAASTLTPFSSFKPSTTTPISATNGALTTNNQKTNEIIDLTSNKKEESSTVSMAQKTTNTNKNINDSELVFINELNDLYEKCYGTSNRTFKLPNDVLVSKLDSNEPEAKYAYLLAELNKHVSKWIGKHVEENPLVILTPVFVDYFNYLLLLEKEFFPNSFKEYGTKTKKNIINNQENNENEEPTNKLVNGTNSANFLNGKEDNLTKDDLLSSQSKHVNGINDQEKTFSDSSKTFPSLVKASSAQPFSQINIFNATTSNNNNNNNNNDSSNLFLFKPLETNKETTKPNELSALPSLSASSNLFKFGSNNSISSTASSITSSNSINSIASSSNGQSLTSTSTESPSSVSKSDSSEPSKLNLFSNSTKSPSYAASPVSSQSTTSSTLASIAPTFKFGSSNVLASSTSPAKPETTSSSLFKSDDTKKLEQSSSALPTSAGFFSFKPTNTTPISNPNSETKPIETSNIFKSFQSGASTTTSSIFSTATSSNATTGTAPASSSFFSFQSNNKPSIFGGAAFGQSGDSSSSSSIFGSTATTPFLASTAQPEGEADDEPYEPPKPESSDVKEEGSVFTKRVKLFYYNEEDRKFCDRGIGNLFIKPINNGESTSLVIRADTTLANILLNVKLSKALPISKIGPKDVSYLCVPNPPIPKTKQDAPCKFLFKVKTEEDANELLEKLNEYKK